MIDGYALVIGVSRYQHANTSGLGDLTYADNDAEWFADYLVRHAGWPRNRVALLTDDRATIGNIVAALDETLGKLGRDDRLVLFWAGHAFLDYQQQRQGRAYFVGHDTDPDNLGGTGLAMSEIRQRVEDADPANALFFIDTCHAAKFMLARNDSVSVFPDVPPGWVYFTAADAASAAWENDADGGGVLTAHLRRGLQHREADGFEPAGKIGNPDGNVTLGELRDFLRDAAHRRNVRNASHSDRPRFFFRVDTDTGNRDIWTLRLTHPQKR